MRDGGDALPCTLLSLTAVSYIVCVWEGGWMKGWGIAAYIVVSNNCQLHCVGGGLDEGMYCCIHCCL